MELIARMLIILQDVAHVNLQLACLCLQLSYICLQLMLVVLVLVVLTFTLLVLLVRIRSRYVGSHLRQPDREGDVPVTVGFFHPYCNAGGGGERVLWIAIRSLQARYPHVRCVVYTGDKDVTAADILAKARSRFNIILNRPVDFIFLEWRGCVEAARFPHLTLLGQSVGSVVLGCEALLKFIPDVYIDTMGYAFTMPLFRWVGGCRIGCYVHYPTISTDMIDNVVQQRPSYNNDNAVASSVMLSCAKLWYYRLFAILYGLMGRSSDVIMVNSSWTEAHILKLWRAPGRTLVLYPPCNVREFAALPLRDDSDQIEHTIVSISQFRPEKDHALQIKSFNKFLNVIDESERDNFTLLLIGSCRDEDDSTRVDQLKDLCREYSLGDRVQFRLNVSFEELKSLLHEATVGIHTMWNEHFGIGIVEMMAAGTVVLAHNSGGPRLDIVTPLDDQPTGFLAASSEEYAVQLARILGMTSSARRGLREVARRAADRFTDERFQRGFLLAVQDLFE